jgi:HK97 family phage major capsid protein
VNYKTLKINILAILGTAAYVALGPLNRYYERKLVLWDSESEGIKAIEKAITEKFGELQTNIKKNQDAMDKALDEVKKNGDTIEKKTADNLKELGEKSAKLQTEFKELTDTLKTRVTEVEQKLAKKPGSEDRESIKSPGSIIAASDQYKAMIASKEFKMSPVSISRKAILNATLNTAQPLVTPDKVPGIVRPGQIRFTIRDLIPQLTTESNLVDFCRELVFTNNAAPQYDQASPNASEGVAKNESMMTFELASAPVITLAHWIGASRQVLSDATQLQGYVDSRMGYGLKLEEENEMLNSSGANGQLNGLRNQATAFSGGATNQSALDTLLKAFLQVSLAYFEASGVVMHPTDWTNILLLKDTLGRYIFSDPHSAETPRVWGKAVVPTPAITQGQFLAGAFDLACAVYDREEMSVRVSDQHADFFTKNLVAILVEERLALVVYRPTALVAGAISYAG